MENNPLDKVFKVSSACQKPWMTILHKWLHEWPGRYSSWADMTVPRRKINLKTRKMGSTAIFSIKTSKPRIKCKRNASKQKNNCGGVSNLGKEKSNHSQTQNLAHNVVWNIFVSVPDCSSWPTELGVSSYLESGKVHVVPSKERRIMHVWGIKAYLLICWPPPHAYTWVMQGCCLTTVPVFGLPWRRSSWEIVPQTPWPLSKVARASLGRSCRSTDLCTSRKKESKVPRQAEDSTCNNSAVYVSISASQYVCLSPCVSVVLSIFCPRVLWISLFGNVRLLLAF